MPSWMFIPNYYFHTIIAFVTDIVYSVYSVTQIFISMNNVEHLFICYGAVVISVVEWKNK